MNRLTEAGVLVENKLFATLDPTGRALTLPSGRVVLEPEDLLIEEIAQRTYLIGIKKLETFTYLPYELSLKNYFLTADSLPLDYKIQRNEFLEQWIKNCEEIVK